MKRSIGGIVASLIATGAICHAADAPAPGDDPVFIAKAARAIDGHIATWYRKQKLPVPAVTDDATFLRRTFLVAIGRIPTAVVAWFLLDFLFDFLRVDLLFFLFQS